MKLPRIHALDLLNETDRHVFLVVQDFALAPDARLLPRRVAMTPTARHRNVTVL